jgi:hypothetical protein
MNSYHAYADPPRTLAERLHQLSDQLQSLGERLKASIASLIGQTVADAVREAVRRLLGGKQMLPEEPFREQRNPDGRSDHRDYRDDRINDPWNEDGGRWSGDDDEGPIPAPSTADADNPSKRWRNAMSAAVQSLLFIIKHMPCRRPVLTAVCITAVAGVTGFVAGPALAAGAGVLASVAGLVLTAESTKSAAEIASG